MNQTRHESAGWPACTEEQIAKWMGRATFDKALGYVGAVSHIRVSGGAIVARVQGTESIPYVVEIVFHSGKPHGSCSCPVIYGCKHIAATLLATIEHRERAARKGVRPEVEQWLSAFRAKVEEAQRVQVVQETARKPASGAVHRILYVLAPAALEPGVIELVTFKARLGVDGAIRATESWSPNYQAWQNPPKFVTPDDDAILRALRTERTYSAGHYSLTGPKGALIWKMMLATGRLYFEADTRSLRLDTPLSEGARRRAAIEWMPRDGDRVQALLGLDPDADVLLRTEPLWYIDALANETGAIDAPIPETLLSDYLDMPPLTARESAVVRASLSEFAPAFPAPPADARSGLRVIDVTPAPVLTLDTFTLEPPRKLNAPAIEIDVASLGFDYGGIVIPSDATEVLVRTADDELVQVARRAGLEQDCIRRLIDAGLQPITTASGRHEDSRYEGGFIMADRDGWQPFLDTHVPALRDAGWLVVITRNSRFDAIEVEAIDAVARASDAGWFDLELGITVEQRPVRLEPLLAELLQRDSRWLNGGMDAIDDAEPIQFRTDEGRRVRLRAARLKPLVKTLIDLFDGRTPDVSEPLRLPPLEAGRLTGHDETLRWQFHGDTSVLELARRLQGARGPRKIKAPKSLKASLRDYQREGLEWMQFLREHDLAGILADDMGLGKTVQTLAHILVEKEAGRLDRPALIVVPTTLVNNWQDEARRFAPTLRLLNLQGPQRQQRFASIAEHDVVITTYPLLWRDHEALALNAYHVLILDEAQYVKNASSKAASIIRTIDARHRLCLTGTPLENHLGELWSQFDFLLPGFLGTQKDFASRWRKPIEKQNDQARRDLLARRVRPFMLRRRKDEVATELPAKTTIVRTVDLEGAQRDLYETVRSAMQQKVREAIAKQGFARSHILMLDALLKLRQVCCDPSLVKLASAKQVKQSAKLALLMEMLPALIEEGRRVLVFSQFTGMLGIIAAALDEAGIAYVTLTGDTADRAAPVRAFQSGEAPVFLISLKAGGVGLNLTAADTVIHYDPWWNPAAENQATDRAHRIGQDKPVFVYKLVASGSIEEKILAMQDKKAALAAGILSEDAGAVARFSEEDIQALFTPIPDA
ncbi:DEAD/DEAH box helicase [Caballeronia sp. LZ016]|uniref:DEAD/DEAH box helicase n=1 Tax=Caballeronia sp. LZ016 TaxID=3038554 RepID=UPI00285BB382|nr:DEAD/DEAH box helicase [Caballeronia sp. LZ016]MDR5737524.1 DEAD/DEAH box helicase [Caballeronia sp. LZ016]